MHVSWALFTGVAGRLGLAAGLGMAVGMLALLGQPAISARAAWDATPSNLSPTDGARLDALGTVVRWVNPAGTTQYQIQVVPKDGDGPGIDLIISDQAQVAAQAFSIPAPSMGTGPYIMLPDMTYYWRLRVSNATVGLTPESADWGPWTTPVTFHTAARNAAAIRPAGPADDARLTSNQTTIAWANGQPDVFYYEVQLSRDPAFNTEPGRAFTSVYWVLIHGGQSAPMNSWTTPQLESRSFYYWRVRPRIQGDGAPVPWSQIWTFETP